MPYMSIAEPTNIIYTGVAGTGKTYQLLQIAKAYTDYLPSVDSATLLEQTLQSLSWREVICLIFLDLQTKQQDLVKVPEIVSHRFFISKAAQNARHKNLNSTAWLELRRHSRAQSTTVTVENRASQAYFDKDSSGSWYLLAESQILLAELSCKLKELEQAQPDKGIDPSPNLIQQRFSMVSFHQAYGYEEFVEGIRPVMGARSQGQMSYDIQDGAFLQLCQRAANDPNQRYAMLIDEINRGNVSRVFGELLSLIEPDKRKGQPNAMSVNLAYSGRTFSVPNNVDIYATMNTQDHSLAPLDTALRRRFRFIECLPKPALLSVIEGDAKAPESGTIDLALLLAGLNHRILQTMGADAQLGHAFLFSVRTVAHLQSVLVEQIIPQLAQLSGGQVAVLQYIFRDEQHSIDRQFIQDPHMAVSHSLKALSDPSNSNRAFASQPDFFASSSSGSGYRINPNLIQKTDPFLEPSLYQRLY